MKSFCRNIICAPVTTNQSREVDRYKCSKKVEKIIADSVKSLNVPLAFSHVVPATTSYFSHVPRWPLSMLVCLNLIDMYVCMCVVLALCEFR